MEPIVTEVLRCDFLEPASWLFFSNNVPSIVYFTHMPTIVLSTLLAVFIIFQKPRLLQHHILFWTVISFVTWVVFAQMFWATNRADVIMFAWLIDILVEPLVHIGILYLSFVLLLKRDAPLYLKLLLLLIYLPIALFLPTPLTLQSFDTTTCLAVEGPIALYYTYFVEIIATLMLIGVLIFSYKKATEAMEKKKVVYIGLGSLSLLLAFSFGNITGSFTDNWELGQYGLIGMPIFIGFLVYSIVQFKVFTKNIIATQALLVMSGFTLFSLLFIEDIKTFRIIVVLNLLVFFALGVQLIRSVRKEVKQKEEIEKLAIKLETANSQLKVLDKMKSEFVSIASHQLRSPLTSIRGYASMLLEGSFGPLPAKAKEATERIAESSKFMASSVEDYLNVSRIQAGNMKYEYSDFNLKDLAERVADDTRQQAMKKGLLLTFKSSLTKKGIVHADIGKMRQVIDNLINNSLKYTIKGSITIFVREDVKKKKIYIDIADTGIGMPASSVENMFEKFERASNAHEVNVTGTGLGLYIARKMAREMGGDINAHSEGQGKGSTFTIELPLLM